MQGWTLTNLPPTVDYEYGLRVFEYKVTGPANNVSALEKAHGWFVDGWEPVFHSSAGVGDYAVTTFVVRRKRP